MAKKWISNVPIHQLIFNDKGQNDWFNGCLAFLMECLGEDNAYDYWFFSGVTGDSFTQLYSEDPHTMALCYSHNLPPDAITQALNACGYTYNYYENIGSMPETQQQELKRRIRDSIDQNIPVIARVNDSFHSYAIICGYDEANFYCILGEDGAPKPYLYDALLFIGNKKPRPSLAQAYRQAVLRIPQLLRLPQRAGYSFNKQAFTHWAQSIQSCAFDRYGDGDPIWRTHPVPSFTCWNMHGTYLCMLGTHACAIGFLQQALRLNPDMTFLKKLIPLYEKLHLDGFHTLVQMEGGFSLPPSVLKDKTRMLPVCNVILRLASYYDQIEEIFAQG